MRNPNGYGGISKLKGNRRNPYVVRITTGYHDNGSQIYKTIGYFPTRKDAMIALSAYNAEPYDIDLQKITFAEVYDHWSKSELPKLGEQLQYSHKAARKYCTALDSIEYRKLRKLQMQGCIDRCGKSESTQRNIKNLLTQLDKYAFDMDIINKCYSANLTIKSTETKQRTPFSKEEISELEKHIGEPLIDETLFMLYTGCRVREMLTAKSADVDLDARTIVLGVKTAAGKNRIVPIHKKLVPIIQAHIGAEYLFDLPRSKTAKNPDNALQTKFLSQFSKRFPNHDTHDCRHSFRSQLDRQEANKVCIDLIIGHKSKEVGERVYTHKTIQELINTINLLDYEK